MNFSQIYFFIWLLILILYICYCFFNFSGKIYRMEKIIVVTHEDDKEAIEAIKKAAWEKAVEILVVTPKSLNEESFKSKIHENKKLRTLVVLGAAIWASSDYQKMLVNVLNDTNLEAKLAKNIEEFNKIFEYREPDSIELESTKGLFDTTPWYDKFIGKGRVGNHWWDKSKFRKKWRIKNWFIYNCNNPDL